MLSRKSNLVVILTTFHNELLRISIPALQKLHKNFYLIIFNDNPDTIITKPFIKKLGYTGDYLIYNSGKGMGALQAKISAVDLINQITKTPDWTLFVDDDDLLVGADIPTVADNNFAIIQNSILLKHNLVNLLKVIQDSSDYIIDDENVFLNKPNISFTCTLIRTYILMGFAKIVTSIFEDIKKLEEPLNYRIPVDIVLWDWLNAYVKKLHPDFTAIYRDNVNYISNCIDSSKVKYGKINQPVKNTETLYAKAFKKYNELFNKALSAALRG